MDIAENPFWVLGATTRDRKTKLIEIAETLTLSRDPETIAAARNALINPCVINTAQREVGVFGSRKSVLTVSESQICCKAKIEAISMELVRPP